MLKQSREKNSCNNFKLVISIPDFELLHGILRLHLHWCWIQEIPGRGRQENRGETAGMGQDSLSKFSSGAI